MHNIPKTSTFSASLGTRGRQREQGSTTTTATVDTKLVGHDEPADKSKGREVQWQVPVEEPQWNVESLLHRRAQKGPHSDEYMCDVW